MQRVSAICRWLLNERHSFALPVQQSNAILTSMDATVTLSENFDLRVPEDVRRALNLAAGEQFRVIPYAGRLEFIPVRKASDLRGFVRGMDTTIQREDEDRL